MRFPATPPALGEKGELASSHDRTSQYDAAKNSYIAWDANRDSSGIVRVEGNSSVLADIQGPGCIWRIWTATPGTGHIKIYLDGAKEPAIDLPFIGYFDGKHAPFNRPNLVYLTSANGYNNYTPISFSKSCKIVAEKDWGAYYNITYTTFAPGTQVPAFSMNLSAEDAAALDEADRRFASCGPIPQSAFPGADTVRKKSVTAPGAHEGIASFAGSGAIAGLRLKINNLPADIEAQRVLLRQIALRINWDGDAQPAVWSPVGDFFGAAGGAVPFRTYVTGLTDDGYFYCNWYMPYAKGATVVFENDSAQSVDATWEILRTPLDSDTAARLLRFHAKWHGDVFPPAPDRGVDWTLLVTEGRGRYVGTQLHIWNPRGGWWGEGDEKFFIDGEKFPSTIGTGSEDYFGYAWSSPLTFVRPLHAQPVNERNQGHISVHRWHLADNLPFQTRFEGVMEKYFPNRNGTHYRAVAYWYLSSDGKDPFGPIAADNRAGPWDRFEVYNAPSVIEAESLPLAHKREWSYAVRRRAAAAHFIKEQVVSGDFLLIWRIGKQPGQRLDIELPVEKPGRYRILGRFINGPEFGIIQFEINGKKIGAPVDTYGSTPSKDYSGSDPVELGYADLPAGTQIISAVSAGKNPAATGYWMGLDYLKLEPVDK